MTSSGSQRKEWDGEPPRRQPWHRLRPRPQPRRRPRCHRRGADGRAPAGGEVGRRRRRPRSQAFPRPADARVPPSYGAVGAAPSGPRRAGRFSDLAGAAGSGGRRSTRRCWTSSTSTRTQTIRTRYRRGWARRSCAGRRSATCPGSGSRSSVDPYEPMLDAVRAGRRLRPRSPGRHRARASDSILIGVVGRAGRAGAGADRPHASLDAAGPRGELECRVTTGLRSSSRSRYGAAGCGRPGCSGPSGRRTPLQRADRQGLRQRDDRLRWPARAAPASRTSSPRMAKEKRDQQQPTRHDRPGTRTTVPDPVATAK